MSDNRETSPSLLNNLRCFRFQKKTATNETVDDGIIETSTEESPVQLKTERRPAKPLVDSEDSDGEVILAAATATSPAAMDTNDNNSNNSADLSDDCVVKGKQMRILLDTFPRHDIMMLQDTLLRNDWNARSAIHEILSKGCANTVKKQTMPLPYEQKKRPKTVVKRKRTELDSEDDSEVDNNAYGNALVFDSDEDSDVEISNELTGDKKRVFNFLQNGTMNELRLMPSCSQKKAEVLMQLRPFTGWVDLVEKIRDNKQLSTDLLNAAQQVITTRNNVQQLMNKCTSLAQQMERAIKVGVGAGIKEQPRLLSLGQQLTKYQMVGLNWLAVMHAQSVNGILADEMGLGKTVQVIAFLAYLKETGATRGTHLIVVPSSTLDNWKCEFERWCPSLEVFVYYGSAEERRMVRIDWSRGGLMNTDVILTTYTMVSSTPEERKMFRVTQMHYVVFDEAHMLKNMNTQRYENLIRIKAMHRILLTGTPLQNNLLELMSLLIFVMPTMFAGKTDDLKSLFQKNGKSANVSSTGETDDMLPSFEREQVAQAKRIMKPFVLRRLKRDVLQELPPKSDKMVQCPMDPTQKQNYEGLIQSLRDENGQACRSRDYNGMAMMTDLRKLSNHPLLLRYNFKYEQLPALAARLAVDPSYKETNVNYLIEDLACMSDFDIHQLTKQYKSISNYKLPDSLIVKSGKFQYLDKVLPELKANNHRVLIFSQFVIMLNVLEEYMKIRNHSYLRLDGQTPVAIRQELIDEYTNDPSIFIFLLSTKAGGLGINLTAADTVLIHDIDFNPYNDKQAEDRCHRMGQRKPVSIYRLISKGTIEEAMFQMAQEKLKLEREITTDENESSEMKSVVRLLTVALGVDSTKAVNLMSPSKKNAS